MNLASKSSGKHAGGGRRFRYLLPLVCALLGCFCGSAAANETPSPRPTQAALAFGDFDGDHKPDLATVGYQQDANSTSRYYIRFKLSSGGTTDISIVGPVGGLRLVAQDVNGDDFEDLTVYSVWQKEVLAVLLNNGRGEFTLADGSAFPFLSEEGSGFYRGAAEFRFHHEILAPQRITPNIEFLIIGAIASPDAKDGLIAGTTSSPKARAGELPRGRSPPSFLT